MIKVVVDRKKWHRGKTNIGSKLLRKDRTMCCIGFLAREMGCKPRDIRGKPVLASVQFMPVKYHDFAADYNDLLDTAYETNDDIQLNDKIREARLKKLGLRMGVKFTFKN